MAAIRVLVVDDSVVIRKLLCETLSRDPELEVVGSAGDGRIALAKISQLRPDLITLDVEMPVMNGLETLAQLRKLNPNLHVIMFSTLTERGAAATLDALSLGASDYVTKPSNTGSPEMAIEAIRAELLPKIKALCAGVSNKIKVRPPPPVKVARAAVRANRRIEIVAIGTSTGGPNALAEVLPKIPADFPVPIVMVQHMPPIFTRLLAERLTHLSAIPVVEGAAGTSLVSRHAWIAPGDFHMTVAHTGMDWHLDLSQAPPEHSCRPSVDVLFRSVAAIYRGSALGVVMTGMGSDGTLGAHSIREAGGEVIVQDEASSVVWGMPGLVYAAGQADGVYPLNQLAVEIVRRVLQSRAPRAVAASGAPASLEPRIK